jgi:phospholipid/cholesterol/gamma-HCH transport system permease protein
MLSTTSLQAALGEIGRVAAGWLAGWWRVVHLGALLLVLAFSRSSYSADNRRALLRHVYLGTAPSLLWFGVVSTLISLVLIRIVLVTALSYGLSQYALEMVVRVLVLELIPLTAALFAALRCTIPNAVEIAALPGSERLLRSEVLPRVAAGVFCALMLAAVSCVVTLLVAYLSVYGLTTSGFGAYTHTVGHVFNAGVSLVFGLKILLLGMAVALVPMATVLDLAARGRSKTSAELQGLVRMFMLILLIEAASLVGNYY